ncbi:hypothetical protein GBA52_011786 [Prunus armeniaca]|nr:hypothetical protein GBA52_011786 [Prunus armeniaca]
MALNLSRGSILPTYPSSVWYSNGYVMDQYKENNLDGVSADSSSSWGFNLDLRNTHWGTELGGYCDHSADDIVDRLPVDPFGMGIRSTFTAITGWLQGFEKEHESYGSGLHEAFGGGLLAGFNWAWNSAVMFQPEVCDLRFDGISIPYDSFDEYGINDGGLVLDGNVEEFLSFSGNLDFCDGAKELQVETKEIQGCSIMHSNGEGSAPHDAMFYALSFLGVKDLLSVEKVCRSFRDSVRSDPLLWRSIVIDWPLNEIVTDDVLIKLTDRAQGTLQALTLVHCVHITDFGLQRVFDSNPKLTKITVFSLEHQNHGFFHGGLSHLSCDDDCAIDIEACPRCQKLSLVYDCPAKSCQGKRHADQMCRACTLCIARCISCGCCLQDTDYEETFCLDLLCIVCLEKILKCRHGEKGAPKCAFFVRRTRKPSQDLKGKVKPLIVMENGEIPENANEHCPGPQSDSAGKSDACEGCPNQQICATTAPKGPDPDVVAIAERMATVKHKILVLSGKGGVGKSTFSAQLAFALAAMDFQVGLLDIDICGPSIPKMLGLEGQEIHQSNLGWSPVYVESNLGVMSIGFMLPEPDDAVIWRGPRKNALIKQFLKDVYWGELDFLVVDAPPGPQMSTFQLFNASMLVQ